MNGVQKMFGCGWYNVKWYNAKVEVIKAKEKYLTNAEYRKEVMKMQTSAMLGSDVKKLVATPIEKK